MTMRMFGSLVLLAAIGCGSSGPKRQPGDCEAMCDRQGAAGCPTANAEYVALCKQLCEQTRAAFPQCTPQMDAIHACVVEKVTYSCDGNGTLIATPDGACDNEDAACFTCTNNILGCFSGD